MMAAPVKPGTSILKKLPSSASADDIRRYLHSGVVCDNCDKEIRGYRYKCLECADFDLCMECEPSNHSQHLLLRIANPNDAEICYRAKLGKRFGRHRRSESLCSKPTEERHHDKKGNHDNKGHHDKKAHHKRHAPCSRPANFVDVVSDILKSVVGTGAEVQSDNASGSNENPKPTSAQENQNVQNGKNPNTSSTATPLNTPLQGTLPFNPCKFHESFLPPCNDLNNCKLKNCMPINYNNQKSNNSGQLKTHIDTLSNMAQNFATMMDPFATYIKESTANIANEQIPAASLLNERVQDILKTLTPDNIDSVFEQIKALNIDTIEKISSIASIISEKAMNEPHLLVEIAKLSQKLSELEDYADALGESMFKKELCYTTSDDFRKIIGQTGTTTGKTTENSRRLVSFVRFIGELYLHNTYLGLRLQWMINDLLQSTTNEKLEALCELLTTAGQKLETRTDDPIEYIDLTPYFKKIEIISAGEHQHKLNKVSSRVRSMLLDLIELRKNKWVQRSEPMDGVNTTEEIVKPVEPQTSAMIVDCTDDEEENIGMLNRASRESSSDGSQSEKSNRGDSPSREWAFVDANEIEDISQASSSAQASTSTENGTHLCIICNLPVDPQTDLILNASFIQKLISTIGGALPAKENGTLLPDSLIDLTSHASLIRKLISPPDGTLAAKKTGTLPKQATKQSQNAKPITDEPSLDYSEISRRLNDHIMGEKTTATIDENLAAARSAATRMGEYLKASEGQVQPVESAPKAVPLESSGPSNGMLTFDNNKNNYFVFQ